MVWTVTLKQSVIDDVRWFGRKRGRLLLREIEERLRKEPLANTKNIKKLRSNPVAQRELRFLGKYRALFNVDEVAQLVIVVLVGEKRGNMLFVQGEEYTVHHESHPSD